MNDANEGKVWHSCFDKEENNEYKEMMQKNAYLKSFSEDGNSEYMWVNYAENFAGMCVAYDFSHASKDLLKELYPVQYSSVGFQCADNKLALLTPYLFTRKDMKWKNEREWRFIKTKPFNRSEAIRKSVEGCICAVYFGSDMDNDLKNKIEYELFLSNCKLMFRIRNLSIAPSKGSLQIIMQLRKSLQRSNTVKLFCYLISRRITCGTLFAQGFAKTKQT